MNKRERESTLSKMRNTPIPLFLIFFYFLFFFFEFCVYEFQYFERESLSLLLFSNTHKNTYKHIYTVYTHHSLLFENVNTEHSEKKRKQLQIIRIQEENVYDLKIAFFSINTSLLSLFHSSLFLFCILSLCFLFTIRHTRSVNEYK